MIAKKFRIPKEQISYILNSGESLTSQLFIVRFKRSDEKFFKYRVVVSKKLEPKAVKRNLTRRQIYESIRLNTSTLEESQGFDLIFIPKKRILSSKFQEILEDIKQIITNINAEPQQNP